MQIWFIPGHTLRIAALNALGMDVWEWEKPQGCGIFKKSHGKVLHFMRVVSIIQIVSRN